MMIEMDDPEPRPAWLVGGRVPCLDGLRALSIALVLFGHGSATAGLPPLPEVVRALADYGSQGVDVFFVISGFLITLLLLREESRNGKVSLRAFYTRRALRILPAYFAYLGFLFLLTRIGVVRLLPIDWAAALTYTTNFLPNLKARWWIGHTWSLSVEEHFYLLWPPALMLLGRRRARSLLVVIFAIAPLVRYGIWVMLRHRIDIDYVTPARMDTIAAGCLLANFVNEPRGWAWRRWLEDRATAAFFVAFLAVVASTRMATLSGKYGITLDRTVQSAAIAAGVFAVVSGPRSSVGRLLESRPMVAVGILSYSLYLWQQPFLNPYGDTWICRWPQNLALTFAAALLSHLLIEQPFLRLKDRLGRRVARPA